MLITVNADKAPAVLMSLEDFASYEETRYLLSSPENRKRLQEAVQVLDTGKGVE